jgi:hypothetical protein
VEEGSLGREGVRGAVPSGMLFKALSNHSRLCLSCTCRHALLITVAKHLSKARFGHDRGKRAGSPPCAARCRW